jgi:replicative DNA helicase
VTTGRPANALERILPQDLDAERALLGALLLEPELVDDVRCALPAGPEEFCREANSDLYDVLLGLHDRREPFDAVLIRAEMTRRGREKLANNEFLAGFLGAVPSARRAAQYAGVVHGHYMRREIIRSADGLMQSAFDDRSDALSAVQHADEEIRGLLDRSVSGGPQPIGHFIDDAIANIQRELGGGLSTGFPSLDKILDGLGESELIVVGGRPSMGKSALLMAMADNVVRGNDKPVLMFSVEMSVRQLAGRLLLARAELPAKAIRANDLTATQQFNYDRAREYVQRCNILVDDSSAIGIGELMARARAIHRKTPLAAVMVDYLQLVRPDRHETVREREVASISSGLLSLAKQLRLPVVAAAQLRRIDRTPDARRPTMESLRESGAIEQDAHKVLLIHRPDWYRVEYETDASGRTVERPTPDPEPIDLYVDKNRNGATGHVSLTWDKARMMYNQTQPHQAEVAGDDGQHPLWQ